MVPRTHMYVYIYTRAKIIPRRALCMCVCRVLEMRQIRWVCLAAWHCRWHWALICNKVSFSIVVLMMMLFFFGVIVSGFTSRSMDFSPSTARGCPLNEMLRQGHGSAKVLSLIREKENNVLNQLAEYSNDDRRLVSSWSFNDIKRETMNEGEGANNEFDSNVNNDDDDDHWNCAHILYATPSVTTSTSIRQRGAGNTRRCQSLARWQWVNDHCPSKVKKIDNRNESASRACEQIRLSGRRHTCQSEVDLHQGTQKEQLLTFCRRGNRLTESMLSTSEWAKSVLRERVLIKNEMQVLILFDGRLLNSTFHLLRRASVLTLFHLPTEMDQLD